MKIKMRKLLALALAMCLALGLAACGSGSGGETDTNQLSGKIYVPEFKALDASFEHINSGCCDGQYIYLVAEIQEEVTRTEEVPEEAPEGEAEAVPAEATAAAEAEPEEETPDAPAEGDAAAGTMEITDYIYRTGIFRVSLDGSEVTELENYAPVGGNNTNVYSATDPVETYSYIEGIRVGVDGTLWVTESTDITTYELPEDFDPETQMKWDFPATYERKRLQRQLDSTGNEITSIDTSGLTEKMGVEYLNNSIMDNDGNLYATTDEKLSVLDKDMNILFSIEEGNLWGQLVLLGDGSVGLKHYGDEGGQTLRTVDLAAKGWGTEYPLPPSANTIHTGSGDYLFYYDNGDSLYGYKAGAEEGEKLLSWSSADINMDNLMFFAFLPDGRVAAMTRDWSGSGPEIELAILTETDAAYLADKTILTYATMHLDYEVRAKIIDFNKSSSKYRIEIRDYSEYNTEEDYSAGLTKLSTEIGAGTVPDILDVSNLPVRQYGAKGVLEDLWPYIEADSEIGGREGLMERVFTAAEQDGKLYYIFDSFGVRTVVGATGVVGEDISWTLADLQDALSTMPEGCQIFSEGDTKTTILSNILAQNMDSFVDWSTGECSFDTPEFTAMLEFCNSFPLEYDWANINWDEYEEEPTRVASGKQMLMNLYLSDFGDIQMYEAIFGGEITYVGYPMEDGSVGSSYTINGGLAMSSTCKDKEGAWSFMRELLLPVSDDEESNYYIWQFPSNKKDFDAKVEEAMKVEYQLDENGEPMLDENGEPIQQSMGGWGWGDLMVEIYATTQEQMDQFMELYNAVDNIYHYDTDIYNIVSEEAASYFNGDKSVKETVELIQSRVNIYVNERG